MVLPALEDVGLVHHSLVGVGRVLEERRPMQRVERADLDADPAVHAQAVVDRKAVQLVQRLALAGRGDLVSLDVDAPARALLRTQHAHRAVLGKERDDAARALGQLDAFVRILDGRRLGQHRS